MVWWWGEGKNLFFEVPAQALLEEVSYWDGILPKRSKLSWNHQMHAMRDREKERTQIVDPCHEQKTTTGTITKEQEFKKIYQETERNECEGKKEKRTNKKKIDRELEQQACTNRLIPSLPHKIRLSVKIKRRPLCINHSGPFPSRQLISMAGLSWEINCVEKKRYFLSGFAPTDQIQSDFFIF